MSDDDRRIQALLDLDILDSDPEPEFEDVVKLAAAFCEAPIALVSLVASDRQWFKARLGVGIGETPIEQSVCAHALRQDLILVIPDLTQDKRTSRNPLVTGPPYLRFYAGAVLRTPEGEAIGTLCVIDHAPRPGGLSARQTEGLLALGRQTMAMLTFRQAMRMRRADLADMQTVGRELREQVATNKAAGDLLRTGEGRLREAQEAGRVGSFEIDIATNAIVPSAEFCRIFGLEPCVARSAADIEALVPSEDRSALSNRETRADATAPTEVEYRIRRESDGELRWIARRADFIRDETGRPLRMIGVVQDVTDGKLAQSRQAALIVLGDELRTVSTVHLALATAARILGEALGATRAGYATVDEKKAAVDVVSQWSASGAPSLSGRRPLGLIAAGLGGSRLEGAVAINDAALSPAPGVNASDYGRLGARAQILAPLVRDGRLVGVLFAHDAAMRSWSDDEVDFVGAVADRTYAVVAKLQAEEQQRLLNAELSHRIKNTLSIVQAIAAQTLRGAEHREDVRAFNLRIMALGKAHDVLLEQSWASAGIRSVVESVLSLHGDNGRFSLAGPDVMLGSKAALSLSMLLHELATNAIKYGALSGARGGVAIEWRVVADEVDPALDLTWNEHGGPPAAPPERTGFGSRLIRMGMCGTGHVALRYDQAGFSASFRAPLALLAAQ